MSQKAELSVGIGKNDFLKGEGGEQKGGNLRNLNVCYIYDHVKQICGGGRDGGLETTSDDGHGRAFSLPAAFGTLQLDARARRCSFDAALPFRQSKKYILVR